jgi:phenylalanyl-tRNA synthetase beta chain
MLLEQGLVKEKMGLLHLKGILEMVFQRLGVAGYRSVIGKAGEIYLYLGQEKLCAMRKVSRDFLNKLEIKNKDVFVAEVYLKEVFSHAGAKKKFQELPLYPGILRDISLVLKEDISAQQVLSQICQTAGQLLQEARVTDYYKGKQIPAGLRSLTVSCLYRSGERTLTDEEINPLHSRVLQALVDKFSVQIR